MRCTRGSRGGDRDQPTPRMLHGGYGFYFTALGDIQFEIACLNP